MILLDSHVVLWLVDNSPRLSTGARSLIAGSSPIFVSSLSHAEFAIKQLKDRLHLPPGFADLLITQGITTLPFTDRHAEAMSRFAGLSGHDPFDHMLLAQAASEGLRFLTADGHLADLDLDWIVDARA